MSEQSAADQIAIANLAVQFLPKIEPPPGWETEEPHRLSAKLAVPTTGVDHANQSTWARFPSLATPFEILSEEAVKRARVLWAAVKGEKRPERIDINPGKEAVEQVMAQIESEEPWRKKFRLYSKEGQAISLAEALKLVLPNSTDSMRRNYYRENLREYHENCRRVHREETLPIVFADEAISDERKIVIQDGLEEKVNEDGFPGLAIPYEVFYKKHGERIRRKYARTAGLKGGTVTQAKKRANVKADAAKYGGDPDVLVTPKQAKKLKSASKRAKAK